MRSDPGNLCSVLNELEELPTRDSDGLHPIAAFVEHLANDQPPEAASPLRAWVDDFVGSRTPHLNAVRSIRSPDRAPAEPASTEPASIEPAFTEPGPPEPPYCAIYIDTDGVDSDLWTVSIFFQEASLPAVPLVPPDDIAYTEAEIRARIGEALNSRQLSGVRPDDIRIEFFLPVLLINLPVDRWRIGGAGIVLGLRYQVVVRCMTRLRDYRSAHADLLYKWSRAGTTRFAVPPGIPGNGYREMGGTGWLTEQAARQRRDQFSVSLAAQAGPVCLLLADAPVSDHSIALVLAFAAGIPILMWSRRKQTDLVGGLSGRLPGATPLWLRDLPRRVLGFRAEAASRSVGPADLANHLTLVYDYSDRIPGAEG